jgi:peptide/nickel transport system permease protein
MVSYVARRALQAVPVLFGVTLISFLLIRLTPGDPIQIMLGIRATPQSIAFWHAHYALNDPLPVQYLVFLAHSLTLDFGESIQVQQPVSDLILSRLGTTVSLMAYSVLISLTLAVPLATIAALKKNRLSDQAIKLATMITFAMPAFWVGLIFVLVFSLRLHWFPASGIRDGVLPYIWSLTLPAVTLGLYLSPVFVRTLRATMVEMFAADHVDAARARGLPEARIVRRYVLRNSLISTVTVLGLVIGLLIGGSLVIENVFALPGLGRLVVTAVASRDFPVVQACVLLIGVWIVVANLATDLVIAALDPRIRR